MHVCNMLNILRLKGAGLIGSPGLIPGCNIGREYAMFEPVSTRNI